MVNYNIKPTYQGIKYYQQNQQDGKGRISSNFEETYNIFPITNSTNIYYKEPDLLFTLKEEDIANLSPKFNINSTSIAITDYGPDKQDKKQNEDFALTAHILDHNKKIWSFTAVADGVSTKTFWPGRTARISCISTFLTLKEHLQGNYPQEKKENIELIRQKITIDLKKNLENDKDFLINKKTIPPSWNQEIYNKNIQRSDFWYNSTLLLSCLGPDYGFIIFAGDGGIYLKKTYIDGSVSSKILLTIDPEIVEINNFVSLNLSKNNFTAVSLSYDSNLQKIQIFMSSDGIDRALLSNGLTYDDPMFENINNADKIKNIIYRLKKEKIIEYDNYSLAYQEKIFPPSTLILKKPNTPTEISKELDDGWEDIGELVLKTLKKKDEMAFSEKSLILIVFFYSILAFIDLFQKTILT